MKQNKTRKLWIVLCFIVLVIGILSNILNINDNSRIKEIEKLQKKEKSSFYNSNIVDKNSTSLSQNKGLDGIVLLNVGEKSTRNITSDDIHNIILIVFNRNNKKQTINVIAIQKEGCIGRGKKNTLIKLKETFDRENPNKMYDAIEEAVDYKVNSYFVYNNDTIKSIVDIIYIVPLIIEKYSPRDIDDIPRLNALQKELEKKYNWVKRRNITDYGWQPLNSLQAVAYSNLYFDSSWDVEKNDWKNVRLIVQIINGMKKASYFELEKIKKILINADHDIKEEQLITAGAAIRIHSVIYAARWIWNMDVLKHNGKKYAFSINQKEALYYVHKKCCFEKDYKPSKAANKYIKTLNNTRAYITEQIEKKSAEKEKKYIENSTNSEGSNYSNNNNSNSSSNKAQKSNNSNGKNNSTKSKKSVNTDPVEPTPPPTPEPEPTPQPEPQPQPEENNSSDVLEE